jgi:predicted Rossmann fold nucleotide-binding protein DprA/Smf involved in DNA uptake
LDTGKKSDILPLAGDEKLVYEILSDEPMYIDEISQSVNIAPGTLSRILLELQLKKIVKALPGGNYVKQEESVWLKGL